MVRVCCPLTGLRRRLVHAAILACAAVELSCVPALIVETFKRPEYVQAALVRAVADDDVAGALKALANGANPNSTDPLTYFHSLTRRPLMAPGTPLIHFAVQKGHREMTDTLLSHGGDVNVTDRDGKTALMLADGEFRAFLIERGADVNVSDHAGRTALDYALLGSNQEAVSLLFRSNARLSGLRTMIEALKDAPQWRLESIKRINDRQHIIDTEQGFLACPENVFVVSDSIKPLPGPAGTTSFNRADLVFDFEAFDASTGARIRDFLTVGVLMQEEIAAKSMRLHFVGPAGYLQAAGARSDALFQGVPSRKLSASSALSPGKYAIPTVFWNQLAPNRLRYVVSGFGALALDTDQPKTIYSAKEIEAAVEFRAGEVVLLTSVFNESTTETAKRRSAELQKRGVKAILEIKAEGADTRNVDVDRVSWSVSISRYSLK